MAARGPEGVTLSFTWVRSEDRTARFVAEVPPDAVSGTYLPTVGIRLEDGSRAELQFTEPPILVDTRGGTLAVNPDRVSFVRSAVGNSRSEILEGEDGRFVLPPTIDRGALAPADPLAPVDHLQADAFSIDGSERPRQIRVWSDVGRSQLLATSEPRADGTWPREDLDFPLNDLRSAWVTAVDGAGNETAPVRVRTHWFVASSSPGTETPSPHRVVRRIGGTDVQPVAFDGSEAVPGRAPDGNGFESEGRFRWKSLEPLASGGPPLGLDLEAHSDPRHGGMTVWDGSDQRFFRLDGETWIRSFEPNGPGAAQDAEVVFDPSRGVAVFFGVYRDRATRAPRTETWEWNGTTWRKPQIEGNTPRTRRGHAMAFDPVSGRVLLYGGSDLRSTQARADFWAWDGTDWTELSSDATPGARTGAVMAWDAARSRLVLFGGRRIDGEQDVVLNDHWEWDGTSWVQVELSSRPPPVVDAQMVYDAARKQMVLLGGIDPSGRNIAHPWTFDGSRWSQSPESNILGRTRHALVYDATRSVVLLHGGYSQNELRFLTDTWEFDGTSWKELDTETDRSELPGRRRWPEWVWDRNRERAVLFGGLPLGTGSPLRPMWIWSEGAWTLEEVSGPMPPTNTPFIGPLNQMAYDPFRRRMVLLEERAARAQTWEWNGTAWRSTVPPQGGPSPRFSAKMVYVPSERHLLLYGGRGPSNEILSDTWAWDGRSWTELAGSGNGPEGSGPTLLDHDPDRNRVVLFQAGDRSRGVPGSTWEWNGRRWNEMPSTQSPTELAAMGYDRVRGTMVGVPVSATGSAMQPRVVEWNGTTWREAPATDQPLPFELLSEWTHDPDGRRILIMDDESFIHALLPPERPTVELHVELPADLRNVAWTGIQVRGVCGGEVGSDPAEDPGARLWGRSVQGPGSLPTLDTNAAPAEAPEALRFEDLSGPAGVERFLAADGRLRFGCAPDAPRLTGTPRVLLDYLEVRFRYELR
jgi:hypothetical protein